MKILNNIKRKSGLKALAKSLRQVKRTKFVHNLVTARKIGIVTFLKNSKDFDEVLNFQHFLINQHMDVSILGYYPEKEIPQQLLLRKDTNIFCKKDVNWFGKPKNDFIDDFCKHEYDILIDLSMEEVFPLRWVSTLSRSKFKVGNLSYSGNPYDLIIDIEKPRGILYLIDQVKHYLLLLNNRFAQIETEKTTTI